MYQKTARLGAFGVALWALCLSAAAQHSVLSFSGKVLDENGKAQGQLYWDAGDGWDFQCGDYSLMTFSAEKKGNNVEVKLASKEGKRKIEKEIKAVNVELMMNGKVYKGSGSLKKGVTVKL